MTDSQREILLHTLGLNMTPRGLPHRNYFSSGPSEPDFDDCNALVGLGLMERGRTAPNGSVCFCATEEGIRAAMGLKTPMADIQAWVRDGIWPRRRKRR